MNLREKFSSLNKNSNISQEIAKEVSKLPTNEEITKEILKELGNEHTKIVLDEDIKNSYYVYLNDTVYLSNRKNVIEDSSRVMLIAHESRHSMQSKLLQKINFLLSNIELIAFIINILLFVIKKFSIINIYAYLSICIISIIPRLILEFDAVIKSVKISEKYLKDKVKKLDLEKIIQVYRFKEKALIPLFIANLLFGKVVRILILAIMYLVLI